MKKSTSFKGFVCAVLLCVLAVGFGFAVTEVRAEIQAPEWHRIIITARHMPQDRYLAGIEFALYQNDERLDQYYTDIFGGLAFPWFGSIEDFNTLYLHILNSSGLFTDPTPVPVSSLRFAVGFFWYDWHFYNEAPTPIAVIVGQPPTTVPYLPPTLPNTLVVNQSPPGQEPTVYLRGSRIQDASPIIVNETTLVPLRVIIENFGATVEWDGELRQVTVNLENNTVVVFIIDNRDFTMTRYLNGVPFLTMESSLPQAPIIRNDRTYLPLRFLGELLELEVIWNPYN